MGAAAPAAVPSGDALLDAGRADEAVAALRIAAEQSPDAAGVRADLGTALAAQERFEEAAEQFRHALELDPRNLNALQNMAEALRRQQRFDEAVEHYRAVLEVDARLAPAHAGLGSALFFLARYDEAVESLARAASLGLEPAQTGTVRRLLGMTLHELGRLDEAAEEYERALRIDSRDTQALDRFGMLRFAQQRYEEALGLYRALAEIEPGTANTHANIGVTLHYLGQREAAIDSVERALRIDPNHATARSLVAQLGVARETLLR